MSKFVTILDMELMCSTDGYPLVNRNGEQLYQLRTPFIYQSDVADMVITVPAGFVTDLASIPRLPFVYILLAKISDMPGVVHDSLYSTGAIPRALADKVLREACLLIGVSAWKVWLIYQCVRLCCSGHYNSNNTMATITQLGKNADVFRSEI